METLSKIYSKKTPLFLSFSHAQPLNPYKPSLLLPINPLFSKTSAKTKTLSNSTKALSNTKTPLSISHHHHHRLVPFLQAHTQPLFPSHSHSHSPKPTKPLSSLIKAISLSVATIALLLSQFPSKPSFASPAPPSPTVESTPSDGDPKLSDMESTFEDYLNSHPDDVDALKALMFTKLKLRKLPEAIDAVDRLILLQPGERQWPLIRAYAHLHGGDIETAKFAFEDLLASDPFRVEAYHGLGMAIGQSEPEQLDFLVKRIEDVIEICNKERSKRENVRDFRLLVAQMKGFQGKFDEALKLYEDLVRENPRDFRPYLCQGMIYTFMGRKEEAERQFVKYRRLVPKGHPYAQLFDQNVIGINAFQMAEKEKE